jgi:CO/xanthine dehydrogenase FAD-binding subunit
LQLLRPRSLAEALRMRRDEGPLTPNAPLDELRGIRRADGGLRIGALATYTDIIRDQEVARALPILAEAAREIGGVQIQNRGTLAGNVANGSPAGDTLPVLAVAEATIVLQNVDGERRVPFLEFYSGYRKSVMREDELITAVEIPPVPRDQWFRKVGTRAAQAISKVVMAGVRGERPRIAIGSVAPTVVRLPRVEEALARGANTLQAQQVLAEEITPIDDLRSTAEYRLRVAGNLLARWWSSSTEARP